MIKLKPMTVGKAFILTLVGLSALANLLEAADLGRRNIVFILTDDQRWNTLGCMGDPDIQTPNIDRLAQRGVLFKNHFVTTSICCASRASILTGQYVRRHGIEDFAKPLTDQQWAATYPALLQQQGYRTGFIGKFGVGGDKSVRAMANKFDFWRGSSGQGGAHFIDPKDPKRAHETSRIGERALEFLADAPVDRPFCLSISFTAPHARDTMPHLQQYQPDDRDLGLYSDLTLPKPATATDEYFRKLPPAVQRSIGYERWLWRFDTPEHYEMSAKNYYRLITGIDREVGRIMAELERRGLADNTVIMYTSDNGYFLGDRKLSDKFFMYEESLRAPLIIYDPRATATGRGRSEEAMTLNIDMAPTMLALAGVRPPTGMQGRSLGALIENRTSGDWRKDFFYEHHTLPKLIPPSEGVRSERWSYIRWINEKPVLEELFDLKTDPLQSLNLVGDSAYDAVLKQARITWAKYLQELK